MTDVTDIQGLSDLSQFAYALGMTFGRQALDEVDVERKVRYVELYERCFHGFRVAVALKLRLGREATQSGRAVAAGRDDGPRPGLRVEPLERPDSGPGPEPGVAVERIRLDQDRERETVSFPILLKTLSGVVAEAQALPGPPPAALPALQELLARMAPVPKPRTPAPDPHSGRTLEPATGGVAALARPMSSALQSGRAQRLLSGAAPLAPPGVSGPGRTGPPGPKPPWLR